MNDTAGQQADEETSGSSLEFPSFPSATRRVQERAVRQEQKWRRILLVLLLGVGLLSLGVWVGQPPDWRKLNLPRVTLEVRGMS